MMLIYFDLAWTETIFMLHRKAALNIYLLSQHEQLHYTFSQLQQSLAQNFFSQHDVSTFVSATCFLNKLYLLTTNYWRDFNLEFFDMDGWRREIIFKIRLESVRARVYQNRIFDDDVFVDRFTKKVHNRCNNWSDR